MQTQVLAYEGLEIDLSERLVRLDGRGVPLTRLEFKALVLFAAQPGKIFSRQDLESGLGTAHREFSRSIDILVSRLRRKLGEKIRQPRFFKTVRHEGYIFVGKSSPSPNA